MCPKCKKDNGWETREYDDTFPKCVYCGYEEYSQMYKRPRYKSKGLQYVAVYDGEYNAYKDKEAVVRIVSSNSQSKKGGVEYLVDCPLCDQLMKPKKNIMYRYYCNNKHKVTVNDKGARLSWQ